MSVHLDNYARPKKQKEGGRRYYQWKVFVDEPEDVLKSIREVEYLLHPTFAVREHTRSSASDGFALDSSGWGGFTLQATVRFKDGREEIVNYFLDLRNGWPGIRESVWDAIS